MPWLIVAIIAIIVVLVILLFRVFRRTLEADPETGWYQYRDALPQTVLPIAQWYSQNWNQGWGPEAAKYPPPTLPAPSVVQIARRYKGLPYRHHHIPAWSPSGELTSKPNEGPGMDCSNFTAWVYNYGRGIHFTSNIHRQAQMDHEWNVNGVAIQRIKRPLSGVLPELHPGDLVYFWRSVDGESEEISHVGLFTTYVSGVPHLIDSHGVGVTEHPMTGLADRWYEEHFSHALRLTIGEV